MKVMKKYFIGLFVVGVCSLILFSCKKDCICTDTRTTLTTRDSLQHDMGKLTEKECLEYNDTIKEGNERIFRTISCKLN